MRAKPMTILEWVEWEIHVTEAFLNPYVRPEPEITRELVELWRLEAREAVIPDAAPGVGLAACRCFEGDYDTDCPAAKTVN